jgi:hypothetical protein
VSTDAQCRRCSTGALARKRCYYHGDLEPPVDLDWLLTNITLYWVTGAINSSFWPYYAVRHEPWPVPLTRSSTPTAYASFPREIRHPPRSFADQVFNIHAGRRCHAADTSRHSRLPSYSPRM